MIELTQLGRQKEIINLLKEGATLNCYADMSTPLIETVKKWKWRTCRLFLKVGATVNFRPSEEINDALWESLTRKKIFFF